MTNPDISNTTLDQKVGNVVKQERILAGLTLSQLSEKAAVSTAMISKIERGHVSASLTTLGALADAMGVPLINFFSGTVERADVSYVVAGEGITVQRTGASFGQMYKLIGRAENSHIGLESQLITLTKPLAKRPLYQHAGVEFMHVTKGEMTYRCADQHYRLGPGDSLSFDSNIAHGPTELHSETVTFLTVHSRPNATK